MAFDKLIPKGNMNHSFFHPLIAPFSTIQTLETITQKSLESCISSSSLNGISQFLPCLCLKSGRSGLKESMYDISKGKLLILQLKRETVKALCRKGIHNVSLPSSNYRKLSSGFQNNFSKFDPQSKFVKWLKKKKKQPEPIYLSLSLSAQNTKGPTNQHVGICQCR